MFKQKLKNKHNEKPSPEIFEEYSAKKAEATRLLRGLHESVPQYSHESPYEIYNQTVHVPINTNKFKGIAIHNFYYDSGVNPEEDGGPTETVAIAGEHIVHDNYSSMLAFQFSQGGPFLFRQNKGPYDDLSKYAAENDAIAAFHAIIETLSKEQSDKQEKGKTISAPLGEIIHIEEAYESSDKEK